jgi:LAO/AO transport system kinase|tara:strand:+ start:9788 stop:10720 length:933 start_codon:yes stop_codon:yes gene_type:complete
MDKFLIQNLEANNQRDLSRLITEIENTDVEKSVDLDKLFRKTNHAIRIGITGPPGAGKSSITNELIKNFIKTNHKVGVIAIDPTSPFSGGSLLGDRVRMNQYHNNENIFIRSMSTQGQLGGLSRKAQDIGDILAIAGKDIIIYETVGVGQGEYDIVNVADLTIIVLVPEAGDEVQLMKAGLIEIGDLFIVNKSDRKGAKQLTEKLKSIININKEINRPIFNTTAKEGKGIEELFKGIMNKYEELDATGHILKRQKIRYRLRVKKIIQEKILNKFWTKKKITKLNSATESINDLKKSPIITAKEIMENIDI